LLIVEVVREASGFGVHAGSDARRERADGRGRKEAGKAHVRGYGSVTDLSKVCLM
jgi:hypothetical protein